ncbi:hypothetical protein Tcan_18632 [Toxocara canis]|uniref:O-acyltransferase WSD1 C-terminal domain-containing protein n=1 Tax=Toxocara canis TaxID=6265 RepID=A0A0B2USL8_TOXCA|nr:hypothetical protein Tcan_18632 [Toxocara canis]
MVCKQLGCWRKRCTCCAKQSGAQHASVDRQECSTTQQQSSSSSRYKQKPPPSSVPPVLRRRLDDGLLCVATFALVKHAVGLLFTMLVLGVLLTCAPIVLIVQILVFIKNRFAHISPAPHNHCDAWWPLRGSVPFRAVITTQSTLDQNLLSLQLTRVFMNEESTRCGCDAYRDIERAKPIPEVRVWDQHARILRRIRLKVVSDLMCVLNDASSMLAQLHSPSSVLLVPNFSNVVHKESCCCLAIFSHDCYSATFCLPRLLSLYTDGQLMFDMEPKMGESFSPHHTQINALLTVCRIMAQTVQFTCVGPLSVLAMCLRRTNPIWKQLVSESNISSLNRRKNETRDGSDETIPMDNIEGEKKGDGRLYRWMRVAHTDQLLRAERILRAATVELFLAFVAGALRRHFRASGIAHPPDVGATVPISYREYVPVEAQKRCDMILLPMQIPSGVEGAIPRIWAVQRRLAGAIDGVLPIALRVSRFLSEISLSASMSRRMFSSLYADSSAIVSVLRASGDVQMDSHRIQSILLYPSLPDTVKAAFTFVQCGTDIMLSVSANALCFPEPDKLLVHFKAEVRCLLDQLSMKLLTLSQATFLPTRVPFMRGTTVQPSSTIEAGGFSTEPTPGITGTENIDVDSCSVEQLRLLLGNVQSELDSMRSSPHIDRAEYVNKLSELENRMQIFHESMATRLGAPICSPLREGAELASSAVAELLAPYKQDKTPTARRFSREFARIDVPRKPSRAD